jgi:SAM-dependent methyltransferase
VVGHFLRDRQYERILDIGCGDGSISVPLLKPGRRLTLLDMSESMLSLARSRVPAALSAAVDTVNGDFLGARLPARAYDVVICLGVLAYFESPEPLIAKLDAVLKPGGTLIVECSDSAHFMSSLMRTYDRMKSWVIKPGFRTNPHAARAVLAGFQAAGFQLAGTYRYCAPTRVMRKLFPQEFHCWKIRVVHGRPAHPRCQWLGNECIFRLNKPAERIGQSAAHAETPVGQGAQPQITDGLARQL